MEKPIQDSLNEELPDELSAAHIGQVLKKARRRSTIRVILVSFVTVLILGAVGFFADQMLLSNAANAVMPYARQKFSISEPNVYRGGTQFTEGILGGQIQMQTYKVIGGIPIPWATQYYQYSIFGGISPYYGDYSPSPQLPTPDGNRVYNEQTEQRAMQFYDPSVHYAHYFNDLSLLRSIPRNDEVEMAISLNRDYSFAQVNRMLPGGVTPAWYWVDTYALQDIRHDSFPLQTYEVYGFEKVPSASSPSDIQTATDFVRTIQSGLHGPLQSEYRQIYDALSHGTGKMTSADVKIIGVVVTGTPRQLMALQGQPYVRASVLGAIANPY